MRFVYRVPITSSAYEPSSLFIALQFVQSELFSHFLDARPEGKTTPT